MGGIARKPDNALLGGICQGELVTPKGAQDGEKLRRTKRIYRKIPEKGGVVQSRLLDKRPYVRLNLFPFSRENREMRRPSGHASLLGSVEATSAIIKLVGATNGGDCCENSGPEGV
jgi:hypothetical protein